MSEEKHVPGERTRTIVWQDPAPFRGTIAALSGLEYLRAMVRGEIPLPPIAALINYQLTGADEGHVIFEFTPEEYHFNPFGSTHGGIASAMIDSATACAVHSTLPAGTGFTTLEIKVNFVRPITIESGRMRCEGRVVHEGARTATAGATVMDREGKLYAHGTSTCFIYQ